MLSKNTITFYVTNWVISLAGKLSLDEHHMELETTILLASQSHRVSGFPRQCPAKCLDYKGWEKIIWLQDHVGWSFNTLVREKDELE